MASELISFIQPLVKSLSSFGTDKLKDIISPESVSKKRAFGLFQSLEELAFKTEILIQSLEKAEKTLPVNGIQKFDDESYNIRKEVLDNVRDVYLCVVNVEEYLGKSRIALKVHFPDTYNKLDIIGPNRMITLQMVESFLEKERIKLSTEEFNELSYSFKENRVSDALEGILISRKGIGSLKKDEFHALISIAKENLQHMQITIEEYRKIISKNFNFRESF